MEGITWRKNKEHNGVEIKFPQRPSRDVINQLKERGFHWHTKEQLWYARHTPECEAFARKQGHAGR